MSAIDDLPPLREVIREHALSARKSLGQNFLLDLNLTARIARAAGPLEEATVVEIGPGPGGLTRALLALGPATSSPSSTTRAPSRHWRQFPDDILDDWRSSALTRKPSIHDPISAAPKRKSSPTCPTTSQPRF